MFGIGGIWIAALGDVRLTPADLTPAQIKEELGKLSAATLLTGYRGAGPVDLDAVAETIAAIGVLLRAHPEIAEIDVNPLVAYPSGTPPVAFDALILLS